MCAIGVCGKRGQQGAKYAVRMHVGAEPRSTASRCGNAALSPLRHLKRSLDGYRSNESGSRDVRMLPVAVIVWFGAWSGSRLPVAPMVAWSTGLLIAAVIAVLSTSLICPPMATRIKARRSRGSAAPPWHAGVTPFVRFRGLPTVLILLAAFATSMGCSLGWTVLWHSDANFIQATEKAGVADVTIRVRSPVTVSPLRSSRCTADVLVTTVATGTGIGTVTGAGAGEVGSLLLPSSFPATVYGDDPICALERDAVYRMRTELSISSFDGGVELRHRSENTGDTVKVAEASTWWRSMAYVQQRFLSVTSRLGEQGRVLVPGLTMGVLGQETMIDSPSNPGGIDDAYAQAVKESFTKSGIMHLMVVSGGHYLLLSALIRAIANRIRLHPLITAMTLIFGVCALTCAVYPSDAVWRAAVMGVLGAISGLLGRRAQAISQLSWTVIVMMFVQPQLSGSFGFALSCAAVLGIALAARPIAGLLQGLLGKAVAGLVATTVSAQAFTLPIQLLIEAQIPVFSIPANLFVAPVINLATICGLIALSSAWWLPELAYVFAWLSSLGTSLMYDCARWLGDAEFSTLVWMQGWRGAVLMLVVECLLLVLAVKLGRIYTKTRQPVGEDLCEGAFAYRRSIGTTTAIWVRESREMFGI